MTLRILSPIHKATRQIGLHLADKTTELGVSTDEAHLLSYLESYGPAPIYELQRVLGHRPSTLTGLLDRLEGRELVLRERNPEDGRSYLVSLTLSGSRLAHRVTRLVAQFEAAVLEGVDERALDGFRRVMEAIGGVTRIQVRPPRGRRAPTVGRGGVPDSAERKVRTA
ncbi:MAG: MarR family transcriptional regulator [Gemmatimonadota bacterium]|jgi:DNA-binding MarR family transcriptional regulator|nr:MAG: MarR family transcriptional regulator [Gemmatimonadota bacterium]